MRVAFVALLVGAAALVAPAGAASPTVVTVGDDRITRAQADHWIAIAARSANRERTPRRGTRAWRRLRDQALEVLIQGLWVEAEAKARGVSVSAARVRASFRRQRRQSFPTDRDFRRFLRTSGFTRADILYRVRLEEVSEALRKHLMSSVPAPTAEEIRRYYDEHPERFTSPEQRDLHVVITHTRTAALRARRALAAGVPFARVVRRYSVDHRTRRAGGALLAIAPGGPPSALERAIFGALPGVVSGPVRTPKGFWVFRVDRIVPGRTQSFEEAARTIRGILVAEAQQRALDAFMEEFRVRWRPLTRCVSPYITEDCANAPGG